MKLVRTVALLTMSAAFAGASMSAESADAPDNGPEPVELCVIQVCTDPGVFRLDLAMARTACDDEAFSFRAGIIRPLNPADIGHTFCPVKPFSECSSGAAVQQWLCIGVGGLN